MITGIIIYGFSFVLILRGLALFLNGTVGWGIFVLVCGLILSDYGQNKWRESFI